MRRRKTSVKKSLEKLAVKLRRESRPANMPLQTFLETLAKNPKHCLRNIFQLIHDMAHHYIPPGVNEYPNDPESINYIKYDTSALFVQDSENPFFADRLLANHLMNVVHTLQQQIVKNKMLLFVGPPGSGKSTFLYNFLGKMEAYTALEEGAMYETVWHIDTEAMGTRHVSGIEDSTAAETRVRDDDPILVVPCPSHDHPVIQIPEPYRRELLDEIIEDRDFKRKLFYHKEYSWVFQGTPCPICHSIQKTLSEQFSPEEILAMLHVRRYEFSRKLGEGVSVFNPGDKLYRRPQTNPELQKRLDAVFKSSNAVSYQYSKMAKTNNGVFAIMDAKNQNLDRIENVHGVISDGIHKVDTFEETINSLFLTLINPEDIKVITREKSFRDRVTQIPIPYIRDYMTEVEIYRNVHGGSVENDFLPRVLHQFARVVVSTRLDRKSGAVREWIKDASRYKNLADKNLFIPQMEIYAGVIPDWISEEDVKRLDRHRRRQIIREGETQGMEGISGRESISMFHSFHSRYRNREELISIEHVVEFFRDREHGAKAPDGFLDSLHNLYDYSVLQEIKEAMFFYNQDQIARDVKNYLFAIANEMNTEVISHFTRDRVQINENYFKHMETRLIPGNPSKTERESFRKDALGQYVAKTLQEIKGKTRLEDTEQFQDLLKRYNQALKKNVLDPFASNDNFRRAIKDYGDAAAFKNYDRRIRDEVSFLMKNLKFNFDYTDKGARQICIYALDKNLVEKFK